MQIERKIAEISDLIQAKLTPHFSEDFGVTLKRFDLSTIEIDKESEDYKDFIHVTKEQQKIQAEDELRLTPIFMSDAVIWVQNNNLFRLTPSINRPK